MRKITVGAQVSMDGVMQAPGGPTEDPTKGFRPWPAPRVNASCSRRDTSGVIEGASASGISRQVAEGRQHRDEAPLRRRHSV